LKNIEKKYLVALKASIAASQKINEIYSTPFEKETKSDGSPVTIADLSSSKIIQKELESTKIPIIGEELEKAPYSIRQNWEQCWCVDPLDGTKEFIKKNGEFVVNIALIENGKPIFGLIASPIRKEIIVGGKAIKKAFKFDFSDIDEPEKWTELEALSKINYPPVIISSRSHFSGDILKTVKPLEEKYGNYASQTMGSALKFFFLCQGLADLYPRLAPTMEWDIAAGQAIYEVLGGEVIDIVDQKPLRYNKESLYNPYFVAKKKNLY
jgi:3'(2'), 5'-bisphosphate nucleotidase